MSLAEENKNKLDQVVSVVSQRNLLLTKLLVLTLKRFYN